MANVVSFTTPLGANGNVSTGPIQLLARATSITGTAFSDADGTVFVDQGGDGVHWDRTTSYPVTGGTGATINEPVIDQYFQIRYTNGALGQNVFRLFANPRDPYGAFLATALPPSDGGAYAVFFFQPGSKSYTWVGRFDGLDAYNAITNAAITNGQNGKYAAFLAVDAIVSDEVIVRTTEHTPDSF